MQINPTIRFTNTFSLFYSKTLSVFYIPSFRSLFRLFESISSTFLCWMNIHPILSRVQYHKISIYLKFDILRSSVNVCLIKNLGLSQNTRSNIIKANFDFYCRQIFTWFMYLQPFKYGSSVIQETRSQEFC